MQMREPHPFSSLNGISPILLQTTLNRLSCEFTLTLKQPVSHRGKGLSSPQAETEKPRPTGLLLFAVWCHTLQLSTEKKPPATIT